MRSAFDVTEGDGVHGETVRPELDGQRLGQPDDAALGGGVVDAHALAPPAGRNGGEVDDTTGLSGLHGGGEGPDEGAP
jgi:hypothetical protein